MFTDMTIITFFKIFNIQSNQAIVPTFTLNNMQSKIIFPYLIKSKSNQYII